MKNLYLDFSASSNADCDMRLKNTVIDGFRNKARNEKANLGTAMHAGLAALHRGLSLQAAIRVAVDDFVKNQGHAPTKAGYNTHLIMAAMVGYASMYPGGGDFIPLVNSKGDHCVELPFAFPFVVDEQRGVTVHLSGVVDAVGYVPSGDPTELIIKDIKNTAATYPQEYLQQYDTSPQMMLYSYIIHKLGLAKFPRVTVDVVFLEPSKCRARYGRTPLLSFTQDNYDNLLQQLRVYAKRLILLYTGERKPVKNYMHCKSMWSEFQSRTTRCPFYGLCQAPTKGIYDTVFSQFFTVKEYNPLTFGQYDGEVVAQ